MKKIAALFSLTTYLTLVPSVHAATLNLCNSSGDYSILCGWDENSFGTILGTALQLIFAIAIVAALFYLVWGGLKWLMSGGDKQAVTSAREHIIAAIIGLVVIFLSFFILNIILTFFLGTNISDIKIPRVTAP